MKFYIAMLEDSEGCGTIEDRLAVHVTYDGALDSFRDQFRHEHGRFVGAPDPTTMTEDQIKEYLADEYGHSGGISEHELPDTSPDGKVHVVVMEVDEQQFEIEAYATEAEAEAALKTLFEDNYGSELEDDDEDEDDEDEMSADDIGEYLEEEHGKSGYVREEEVQP